MPTFQKKGIHYFSLLSRFSLSIYIFDIIELYRLYSSVSCFFFAQCYILSTIQLLKLFTNIIFNGYITVDNTVYFIIFGYIGGSYCFTVNISKNSLYRNLCPHFKIIYLRKKPISDITDSKDMKALKSVNTYCQKLLSRKVRPVFILTSTEGCISHIPTSIYIIFKKALPV